MTMEDHDRDRLIPFCDEGRVRVTGIIRSRRHDQPVLNPLPAR